MTPSPKNRNSDLERALLLASGLFDADWYSEQLNPEFRLDPAGHYLQIGWRSGFNPNESFPGEMFRSCFATLGFDEPPVVTWMVLRSAGWPIPARRDELVATASRIVATGLFDEAFYAAHLGKVSAGLDLVIHYVAVGDRLGLAPSLEFDPDYYGRRYPDVAQAGINFLLHYFHDGRAEGRNGLPRNLRRKGKAEIDPKKENILLVVHEATRTGAPILGWNIALHLAPRFNIYVACLGDGELISNFEQLSVELYGPFARADRHQNELDSSLREVLREKTFRYAIVNSAESRYILETCAFNFVPTLLLMHEFACYVSPASDLRSALDWSTEVVFPSSLVRRAADEVHPALRSRTTHILPQGVSSLPDNEMACRNSTSKMLDELIRQHSVEGVFVVLGAGAVQIRKGVDLFISAAAMIARSKPDRRIRFVWVGYGFLPTDDMGYSVYLQEQLRRSGIEESVIFLDEVTDLEPIYRLADVFFLSSRLDPLPNVSIDAAVRGIPLVCFRDASGTAELMLRDPETAKGVVDHLDAEAAGRLILELAGDEARREAMAEATRRVGLETFNMGAYVATLNRLGFNAAGRMDRRAADARTLLDDPTFDQDMFLGPTPVAETRGRSITRYLTLAGARGWGDELATKDIRRPCPGFHPQIYASAHKASLDGHDALADFVRRGRPAGPWQAVVLKPDTPDSEAAPAGRLRVALHAHFFYPELAGDFLRRLESNKTKCDLLISTDQAEKARQLEQVLGRYCKGSVDVRVFPNRGRDIGPLLTGFAHNLSKYDLIGHVHAKRSLLIGDGSLGERWREFLWQHLIGDRYPMADKIISAFEKQDNLGLVFPSDSHLVGWDDNRDGACEIAARIGWPGALPDAFDFPLGTMFWMRTDALQPLIRLGLNWDDYPQEPLAYDGTILHALERLPTMVTNLAGFSHAVTHLFGVSW